MTMQVTFITYNAMGCVALSWGHDVTSEAAATSVASLDNQAGVLRAYLTKYTTSYTLYYERLSKARSPSRCATRGLRTDARLNLAISRQYSWEAAYAA